MPTPLDNPRLSSIFPGCAMMWRGRDYLGVGTTNGYLRDIVHGAIAQSTAGTIVISAGTAGSAGNRTTLTGVYGNAGGGAHLDGPNPSTAGAGSIVSGALTVLVICTPLDNLADTWFARGASGVAGANDQFEIDDGFDSAGTARFIVGSGSSAKTVSGGVIKQKIPNVIIGTADATTTALYLNGVQTASGSTGFTPNQSPNVAYTLMSLSGGGTPAFGYLHLAACWPRAFSMDEGLLYSTLDYWITDPAPRRPWWGIVSAAAAGLRAIGGGGGGGQGGGIAAPSAGSAG